MGRQHGEALRGWIAQHLDLIYSRGMRKSGLTREGALLLAESFVPFVQQYSPGFWEEIEGLAEGANIPVSEAMLLQVRQEVAHIARHAQQDLECTSFAVAGSYTANGYAYAGQNADLSGPLEEFTAVVNFAVTGKPAVMMVIPAGQISYIGMNSEGISGSGNFLHCTGWRRGYPRYLLTRLGLEQRTVQEAVAAAVTPPRASSRNLLFAGRDGSMANIENTAQEHAVVWGEGCLVHTNHYLVPHMVQHELSKPHEVRNSCARYDRLVHLLESRRGAVDLAWLQAAYRDHANDPDSICAHRVPPSDTHTFASMICRLSESRLDVARGPVCENEYATYTF